MLGLLKNRKGFTLVELIVVISILAILAAIAIPIGAGIIADSKESSDAANVAIIQSAIEKSVAAGGDYPTTKAEVVSAVTTYTNMGSIPAPATSGKDYAYNTTTHEVSTQLSANVASPLIKLN